MVYDPAMGALHCDYCDTKKVVEKHIVAKRDFISERAEGDVVEGSSSYECPNCGATVEMENFATTTECPFCGATNIVRKEQLAGLKPDSILPFILPRDKALEAGKKWLKRRLYAPTKLKKNFKAEHFKGIYVPSFVFAANTFATYDGQLGEDYYVTVRDTKGNSRVETRTRWFNISGSYGKNYSDIVVEASSRLTQSEMEKILPFDTVTSEQYRREYLAGFSAERYNDSLDNSFGTARDIMEADLRASILAQYKYDHVGYLNVSAQYSDIKFNYMLLPVWVCGYKFRDKLYSFLVNGRTGKSTGKTPVSIPKVLFTVLVGLGIISVLVCHFLGLF